MIPWWGWLIISLAGVIFMYWLINILFVVVWVRIMKEFWND